MTDEIGAILMTLLFRAAALSLLLSCAACIPIPHYYRYAPAVQGSVYRDGQPVAGAAVELKFGTLVDDTKTDATGQFKVGPIKKLRWSFLGTDDMPLPLDARFQLTIREGEMSYAGVDAPYWRHGDGYMRVTCNLSAPSTAKDDYLYCVEVGAGSVIDKMR